MYMYVTVNKIKLIFHFYNNSHMYSRHRYTGRQERGLTLHFTSCDHRLTICVYSKKYTHSHNTWHICDEIMCILRLQYAKKFNSSVMFLYKLNFKWFLVIHVNLVSTHHSNKSVLDDFDSFIMPQSKHLMIRTINMQ